MTLAYARLFGTWEVVTTTLTAPLAALVGAGIGATMTVEREDQLAAGARMLRESNGTSFVLVKVSTADPPKDKLSLDGAANRVRFRHAMTAKR